MGLSSRSSGRRVCRFEAKAKAVASPAPAPPERPAPLLRAATLGDDAYFVRAAFDFLPRQHGRSARVDKMGRDGRPRVAAVKGDPLAGVAPNITALAISGHTFFTGGEGGRILAFCRKPRESLLWQPPELCVGGPVRDLAVSSHGAGHVIAACRRAKLPGADADDEASKVASMWNVPSGASEASSEVRLQGHRGPIHSIAVSPSHPTCAAATASADGCLLLWDVHTGSNFLAVNHGCEVVKVTFRPGVATELLTVTADGLARIWDLRVGYKSPVWCVNSHHGGWPSAAISGDASIALVSESGVAQLFDLTVGGARPLHRWRLPHCARPQDVAFVSGSKFVVMTGSDGFLYSTRTCDGSCRVLAVQDPVDVDGTQSWCGLRALGRVCSERHCVAYTFADYGFGMGYVKEASQLADVQ